MEKQENLDEIFSNPRWADLLGLNGIQAMHRAEDLEMEEYVREQNQRSSKKRKHKNHCKHGHKR